MRGTRSNQERPGYRPRAAHAHDPRTHPGYALRPDGDRSPHEAAGSALGGTRVTCGEHDQTKGSPGYRPRAAHAHDPRAHPGYAQRPDRDRSPHEAAGSAHRADQGRYVRGTRSNDGRPGYRPWAVHAHDPRAHPGYALRSDRDRSPHETAWSAHRADQGRYAGNTVKRGKPRISPSGRACARPESSSGLRAASRERSWPA
jgi:hypothetical protein